MVNFIALISLVKAGCKRPLISDPHFFSRFSNTNLVVWLNVFFSQKILNVMTVAKYCIATIKLSSKSIAKYGKFILLKRNKLPYL